MIYLIKLIKYFNNLLFIFLTVLNSSYKEKKNLFTIFTNRF